MAEKEKAIKILQRLADGKAEELNIFDDEGGGFCGQILEEYDAILAGIEALKEQRPHGEWIPCSERLPEEHGYYIVQTDGSHNDVIDIAEFGRYGNLIWGWNKASKVIAWMPLPEPYKKEGDEK